MKGIVNHEKSRDSFTDFNSFYEQVPQLENPALYKRALLALSRDVFGNQVALKRFPGALLQNIPVQKRSEENKIADTIEDFYHLENQMMEAVSRGDAETALSVSRMQELLTFIPRSTDEIVTYHGKLVVLNVLCRKAIEKGGVHPVHIDAISSRISRQIMATDSLPVLRGMSEKIIEEYCRFAVEHASRKYHRLVEDCILYIDLHFSENPSLAELARKNYVSKQYLSVLFQKETGQNLTSYVHARQLDHAARPLVSSALPVEEIAERCGQGNVSYFTKLFKKRFGMSPREYRKSVSPLP